MREVALRSGVVRRNFGENLTSPHSQGRFLTIAAVARELDIATPAAYRLLRSGTIAGIKLGTKGFWRVERCELDRYIASLSAVTIHHPPQDEASPEPADDAEPEIEGHE